MLNSIGIPKVKKYWHIFLCIKINIQEIQKHIKINLYSYGSKICLLRYAINFLLYQILKNNVQYWMPNHICIKISIIKVI